jgi:hypothetical protein
MKQDEVIKRLAIQCDIRIDDVLNHVEPEQLYKFAKAIEADFVSRCVKVGHFHPNPYHGYQQVAKEFEGIDDKQVKLYTLPTITE